MVRDLLEVDAGAISQASLPRLPQNWVEGLGPALKGAVEAWGRRGGGTCSACSQDERARPRRVAVLREPAPGAQGITATWLRVAACPPHPEATRLQ